MSGFILAAWFLIATALFTTVGLTLWSLFNINGMTVIIDFLNGMSDTVIYVFTLIYNILVAYTGGGFAIVWKVAFALVSLWLGFQVSRVFISGVRILFGFIFGLK